MNTLANPISTTEPATQPALPTLDITDQTSSGDFLKNNWWWLALIGLTFVSRVLSAPWYVESRDGLFFVRALDHYSVVEMRPHWPGYPVYIWLGKLFYLVTSDPVRAFHLLSALASSLTVWPLVGLARSWAGGGAAGRRAGLLASGLWALAPLSWLGGTEIFSDPLGMGLALTMLWLSWLAIAQPPKAVYLLPLAGGLAGLMLGTRLSYVTLLLPLAYAVWYNLLKAPPAPGKRPWRLVVFTGLSLGLTVVAWFGWQLLIDGWKLISAGQNHLAGHYSEWGGSAATDHQLFLRPLRFLETNLVYGLGGWWPGTSLERWGATLGWSVLLILGGRWLIMQGRKPRNRPVAWLLGLWGVPYALWILLGNDVDLARYDFPLLALACLVAALGLPRDRRLAWPLLLAMTVALVIVSLPQAVAHRDSPPIGVRLADYARQNLNPAEATVVVNEDTAPLIFFMLYQAPAVPAQSVLHSDQEQVVTRLNGQGRQVYLTALPGTVGADWTPVARLCRNQYLESRGPLEVWLYRYQKGGGSLATTPPACS